METGETGMKGRIQNRGKEEPRLPLAMIGRIKIGMKDGIKPRSVDYFIPQSKYAGFFKEIYGEKPDKIEIIFLSDDPELSCKETWEYRDDQGRLYAEGDGFTYKIWSQRDGRYNTYTIEERPELVKQVEGKCPSKKGWHVALRLRFILPRIKRVGGYWEFMTMGNASTIPNIRDAYDAWLENRGSVMGYIFDLSVQFAKSNKPGVTSRYPVVTLVPNHSDQNIELCGGTVLDYRPPLLGGRVEDPDLQDRK
jgi:hypothetical protein